MATEGYRLTIDGMRFTLTIGDHPALVCDGDDQPLYPDEGLRLRVEAGSSEAVAVLAAAGFSFDDCRSGPLVGPASDLDS